MARRYHLSPLPPPGIATLSEALCHHLVRVMRVRPGDTIGLFDGSGRECDATITEVAKKGRAIEVRADVGSPRPAEREPRARVHLAFAPPKGPRAEWLFEHGTEVGIHAFHPVRTARLAGSPRSQRWERIVIAAAGQCDRGIVPQIHPAQDLATFLASADLPAERYVADLEGPPLTGCQGDAAVLLVGPEGGLSEAEIQAAESAGFVRRSLGVTTLRAETAALAGAVLLIQGQPGGVHPAGPGSQRVRARAVDEEPRPQS